MGILSELKPERVMYYFEEISKIPHGSSDTKAISDYLLNVAKSLGLQASQDEMNNVIIRKAGQGCTENAPVTMLQGHMDMVCEKESWSKIDFKSDSLELMIEDGFITANGTTLGGDDGIAVAYALAILESKSIIHPPLEAVFTVDEEIGMLGATNLDKSSLKSRYMLNIDSEDEGVLLAGCAGGMIATVKLPIRREERKTDNPLLKLSISNLKGGHSGIEINKGRANAIVLMGDMLKRIKESVPYDLISIDGGAKVNVISRECSALICVRDESDYELLHKVLKNAQNDYRNEYKEADDAIEVTIKKAAEDEFDNIDITKFFSNSEMENIIKLLLRLPNGIQKMCKEPKGVVQTSLNLGIISTSETEVKLEYCVRSSLNQEKEELYQDMIQIADKSGATTEKRGEYPAWEYKNDSTLRSIMTSAFEEQYGYKAKVEVIHAGVECGIFADAIDNLDVISFGPDIKDIHTPRERLDIASVQRTWEYILRVLEGIAKSN